MKKNKIIVQAYSVLATSMLLATLSSGIAMADDRPVPITTSLSETTFQYVGQYKVTQVRGKNGSTSNGGSLTAEEKAALPEVYLLTDQKQGLTNNYAGSTTEPLTKAQYDAMVAAGTFKTDGAGNITSSGVAAIMNGYAFEQGEEVDINLNEKIVLSDKAKADGWSIVKVYPRNLTTGLVYNRSTGHITGSIRDNRQTDQMDNRIDITVQKAGSSDTYTLTAENYVGGAILTKDTKAPTISTANQVYDIGENVSTNVDISDNSYAKAFKDNATGYYNENPAASNEDRGVARNNAQMGIFLNGLPDGLSYDKDTGKIVGKPTKAGIYNVQVMATDWPDIRTDNAQYAATELPNSSYKTFTITVRPTVKVSDVKTGYTEIPVKVSAGSTKLTLTVPTNNDNKETVVLRRKDDTTTWEIIDNYKENASQKTTFKGVIGTTVTATEDADGSQSFKVPVQGTSTIVGTDNIKAIVEAEQVSAKVFGGKFSNNTLAANFNYETNKWVVTGAEAANLVLTTRVPKAVSSESDVKFVTAKYTRTVNDAGILVKTEFTKEDVATTNANWITLTRNQNGTWTSSDGTVVTATPTASPDLLEQNDNGTWTLKTASEVETNVARVQNENTDSASIVNDPPTIITEGGNAKVGDKLNLLSNRFVKEIKDDEDDRLADDSKVTKIKTIKLVDPEGNEVELSEEEAKNYEVKNVGDYKITITVEDSDGATSESTYTVKVATEVPAVVITKYQDEQGNPIDGYDDETEDTTIGKNYTTEPKEIDGYELIAIPANATGVVDSESIEVIYKYKKLPASPSDASKKVIVVAKYVDDKGNILAPSQMQQVEKDSEYTTEAKKIDGYKLVASPSNATGTASDGVTTVVYEYKKLKTIKLYFKDTDGNTLKDPKEITLVEGEEPELPEVNTIGSFKKINQTVDENTGDVTYIYDKKDVNSIVVYFKDEAGNTIKDRVVVSIEEGEDITSKLPAKTVDGYTYVREENAENGDITYIFKKPEKAITVFFKDEQGNTIKDSVVVEVKDGEDPTLPEKAVDGYTYVREENAENGDITYIFKKSEKITVFFEDEAGNTIKDSVVVELKDGEDPTLPEKSVSGYTYVRTVNKESGDIVYIFTLRNEPNGGGGSNGGGGNGSVTPRVITPTSPEPQRPAQNIPHEEKPEVPNENNSNSGTSTTTRPANEVSEDSDGMGANARRIRRGNSLRGGNSVRNRVPKTADSSNMAMYLASFALATFAFISLKKRKDIKDKE